jgi:hypothetical protein
MKLKENSKKLKLSTETVEELNKLALNGVTDIESNSIKSSSFYGEIQSAEILDLMNSKLNPEALLLVIKITAKGSSLHTLNMMGNYTEENASEVLEVAKILPSLSSLHTLNINKNDLGEHAIPIIDNLAKLSSFHVLCMSGNDLYKNPVKVAQSLAQLPSLSLLGISGNYLKENALEVVKILASSHSLCSLYMDRNHITDSCIDIVNTLIQMPSLHKVWLKYNECNLTQRLSMEKIFKEHNQEVEKTNEALSYGCFILYQEELLHLDIIGVIMQYNDHTIDFQV